MTNQVKIEDLYSDGAAFDKDAALQVLKENQIRFDKENQVLFGGDPSKYGAKRAVLLYALAKKVLKAHEKIESEAASRAEVAAGTGISANTVGVAAKRLKDQERVLIRADSGYEIPSFKIQEVLDIINNGERGSS